MLLQLIVLLRIPKKCMQLCIEITKVILRKHLSGLRILVLKQHVLPLNDISGVYIAHVLLSKVRNDPAKKIRLLRAHRADLQPRPQLLQIEVYESRKRHSQIFLLGGKEVGFPLLGFSLRCKATFSTPLSIPLPIFILQLYHPGLSLFILIDRHIVPPLMHTRHYKASSRNRLC